MRQISAAGLAKLATRLGTEPIFIIEVDWAGSTAPISYADRDVHGIKGRILEVSDLDNIIDVQTGNSQELTVRLDDTDGTIKAILDANDVHQRNVNVYQFFDGLDLSDKFLLFQGKLSSPIVWSEGDRSVTFTIISQLEDKEFGFSAEEGQFPFLPNDMVGKAWPVIFGKVLDVPALQVNKAVSGTTLCGVGIVSGADLHSEVPLGETNCSLGMSLAMMQEQVSFLNACSAAWTDADEEKAAGLLDQANAIRTQMSLAISANSGQRDCGQNQRENNIDVSQGEGCNPVRILGGEDFPQNTPIELNINGGLFTGTMTNDSFLISSRRHLEDEAAAQVDFDGIEQCEQDTPPQPFDFAMDVPAGKGDFLNGSQIRRHGLILCTEKAKSRPSIDQVARHFWADAGSRAVMSSDEPITYIVSITPGTVLAVKAYKQFVGERRLVNVPNDLWTVETKTYGTITAVQVVLSKPLSTIVDQGWGDDIYVTFESTVGPNTVDILRYVIENYTDLDYDTTSFDAVEALLDPFPMNFPVLDRRNALDLIKDIAFQARCAVWISNGTIYLKYLPAEPASDSTITVSDTVHKSTTVELTPTEDLVTKMVVTWRVSWADGNGEKPKKFILRNNVPQYGTKEEEFDFFCFNQPDIILKAATFWLIRKSNTWKKIKFQTYLPKLNLETFDTVTLDLPAYVASSAVKAVVEKANYNSLENTVDFECWVPVRAGEMTQYKFAWPAALTVADTFEATGGGGIGAGATGELPIGFTDGITGGGTVFVGGPNVVYRSQSDRGDRTPGDTGFTAQQILPANVFGNLTVTPRPLLKLKLNYVDPLPAPVPPSLPSGGITIDIRRTKIIDSDNPGVSAVLASLIEKIASDLLHLKTSAKFSDGTNDAEFDFKHDADGGKFGAGTAFLKDD